MVVFDGRFPLKIRDAVAIHDDASEGRIRLHVAGGRAATGEEEERGEREQ
jgi:hypothetical protein